MWFIVGIDGDQTPDPEYWRDRWELIEADSPKEARQKWVEMWKGWLQNHERHHIFVDEVDPHQYGAAWLIRKHRRGL